MDILVSKWIGLEGTAILARQREEELRSRYAQPFVDQAKKFAGLLSVRQEAAVAAQSGVAAMHDISEGGVFGALWEMGQCSGVGLDIDLRKIPIRQETVEICEFFDLNPYKLISGGSLLMASSDGNALVRAIERAGGSAVIIGKATDGNDRVLRNGEECRFLETTQTDELWKLSR
jgi:hydrogenase maturation factor